MNDILSQEEIDALLKSVSAEEQERKPEPAMASSAPAKKKEKRSVRIYDFSSPDKFSKDQMRTIQMIHDNFTRYMNSSLSAFLRTVVNTVPVEVTETSYQDFVKRLPDPTVLGIFSLPPLEGSAVLQFDTELVFAMYDRLLGGTGEVISQKRELTDIEQSVVEGVVNRVLAALRDAWMNVTELNPKLEALETNPAFVTIVAPNDRVASLSFEVKMGEVSGVMHLCIPHIVVEPIAPQLSAQLWFSGTSKGPSDKTRRFLQNRLEKAKVLLRAELGRTKLQLKDLLDLKQNDLIRLETATTDPIQIKIGGRVKFKAQAGMFRGKMAVQIIEVCQGEGDG